MSFLRFKRICIMLAVTGVLQLVILSCLFRRLRIIFLALLIFFDLYERISLLFTIVFFELITIENNPPFFLLRLPPRYGET